MPNKTEKLREIKKAIDALILNLETKLFIENAHNINLNKNNSIKN